MTETTTDAFVDERTRLRFEVSRLYSALLAIKSLRRDGYPMPDVDRALKSAGIEPGDT